MTGCYRGLVRPTPFLSCALLTLASCAGSVSNGPGDAGDPGGQGGGGTDDRANVSPEHAALGSEAMEAGMHGHAAPNTAGILRSTGETAFDVSAPATVLVGTKWGHGSGVIIDEAGWVLTNAHVVEAGETEDFGIATQVTLVEVDGRGVAKAGKTYSAVAHKLDRKRDLALLKLQDVGDAKLPTIALAKAAPKPGRAVAAIGNAGAGFGWAIKQCTVNAVGSIEDRATAIFNAKRAGADEKVREDFAAAVKRASQAAGLQIQTDCNILPGDSGGPLIDSESHELVGLNVAVNPARTAVGNVGSVAFHIHLDEITDFLSDRPQTAQLFVPDPWEMAGDQGSLQDTDRDGEIDTFLIGGGCLEGMTCHAAFVDIDQDSFRGRSGELHLPEIFQDRLFDAEFVVFQRARLPRGTPPSHHVMPISDVLFYFDADNSGELDGLVVVDGETDEQRGYRLAGGTATRAPEYDGVELGQDLFKTPALKSGFKRLAAGLSGERVQTKDPGRAVAVEVETFDNSGDGKMDTAVVQTRLDTRAYIDADQDSLPGMSEKALIQALADGSLDAEMLTVASTPYQVFYDTDGDGKMDTLLEGLNLVRGVALEALSIGAGAPTSQPEHIGRRLLRPGLLDEPSEAKALEKIMGRLFPGEHAKVADGLSSFPSLEIGSMSTVAPLEGQNNRVVQVSDFDHVFILADLDGDSFKGKASKSQVHDAVVDGSYDAEFIYVFNGLLAWSYYDTDDDGSFDLIMVSYGDQPLVVNDRFDLGKQAVRSDTAAQGSAMFEAKHFKGRKMRKAFTAMKKAVVAQ